MRYNGNKFSVYTSEEKTVLGLLDELGSQVNHNTDTLDNKTDLYGDHKGTWQGLNKPTMSEEGMRATVEDIINNKIPPIESSLETIETQKATKVELDIERKRINNLTTLPEGSTTGDAELIDGRIGADGFVYNNIGDAIREQKQLY